MLAAAAGGGRSRLLRPFPVGVVIVTLPAALHGWFSHPVPAAGDKEVALLSRWSIQYKLLLCVALLCLIVATLAISGFRGVYSYRQLARTISVRASELPLAGELSNSLGDLRVTLSRARNQVRRRPSAVVRVCTAICSAREYGERLGRVDEALRRYRQALESEIPDRSPFQRPLLRTANGRQPGTLARRTATSGRTIQSWVLEPQDSVQSLARPRRRTCTTWPARSRTSCTTGCTHFAQRSESRVPHLDRRRVDRRDRRPGVHARRRCIGCSTSGSSRRCGC